VAKRNSPDDIQVALVLLRALKGWNQTELAEAAGLSTSQISHYETGRRRPSEKSLQRLLDTTGVSVPAFRAILAFLHRVRSGEEPEIPEGKIGSTSARALSLALDSATAQVLGLGRASRPEIQRWMLCERLCAESERVAAANAGRALELADLALRVAQRIGGAEGFRVQAYAWAYLGNARRVTGDLASAEDSFLKARRLLKRGAEGGAALDGARILDLEASLRRDQRRFSEALELLEKALSMARNDCAKGRLLLIRASTLEQMGELEPALDALEGALPFVDHQSDPRNFCVLQFNRVVILLQLSRVKEAAALVPSVREMAAQLGNELDLIRVRWLEARVAVGQGRRAEALEALAGVKEEFAVRGLAYDAALVALELAALYLEDGRTSEVKALAEEMGRVFQSQGVHREALAALRIFSDAAAREAVTLDLAQRLVAYLERARHDPELRFGM
jgi:transcriptional regulator with XRE-family HTH domain